jgi:DNA primase
VRQAITLLLHYPAIGAEVAVPAELALLQLKGVPLLVELLALVRDHPGLTPGAVVERYRERPEYRHLAELLAEPQLVDDRGAARELADSLVRIVVQGREERMAELLSKAEAGGLTGEEKAEFRQLQRGAGGGVR